MSEEFPLYGVLTTAQMRTVADALDALASTAHSSGVVLTQGTIWLENDEDEGQPIAFRCSDEYGDHPRIAVFGDNDTSPEF